MGIGNGLKPIGMPIGGAIGMPIGGGHWVEFDGFSFGNGVKPIGMHIGGGSPRKGGKRISTT